MPRRVKDEERVETIIRGLLKLPENRRCINCNSLGPQYVCTTFYTFVCTICSGVHREFTHRVKSVSMAKFTDDEIASLQAGGNERAREIYFRAWDPVRDSYPDASKLSRLREFIKGVYIDRKYAAENKRNSSGGREDQSSPFKKGGGLTFRDFMEQRSPRGGQRNRSAAQFEIVDDRFRDDGGVKRYERGFSSRSLVSQPSLGEKAPPLRIEGPPKSSEKKVNLSLQNGAEARVPVAAGEPQKQKKAVHPTSLIDFDAKSELTETPSHPKEAVTTSEKNNETSSVSSPTHQKTPNAPDKNSLEYMLFDMSDDPVSLPSSGAPQIPATAQSDSSAHIVANEQSVDDNSKDLTLQKTQQSAAYGEAFSNQQSNKSSTSTDLAVVPSVQLKQSSQATDQEDGSKATGRKEIPQELFSSDFGSFAPAAGGWQMHQPYGQRYGMQYRPNAMPVAAFPNPSRPKNPFDIGEDGFQTQAPMFPSTALIAQPSPYPRAMPPHMSPYGMNMPQVPGAYMGQLPNNSPHTRPQVDANIAEGGDAFAYHNPPNQTAPNQSSRTGNPFG